MRQGGNILRHLAVIMDGNGRWAKSRGLPRIFGHKKGAEALRAIVQACMAQGIAYLTIYAFSSENWKRSDTEVLDLMELLRTFLEKEVQNLHQHGVRVRMIGDLRRIPADIRTQIDEAEALTQAHTNLTLNVALSYGGRSEIVEATKALIARASAGEIRKEDVNEETFSDLLYTRGMPDPDLLIRTAGEHRLSNFLLWQSAYTELYFSPVFWPDFTPAHLQQAIDEYHTRERRYGTTA